MQPDKFYHIYNHANGNENIFRTDENYHYFLKRFAFYIAPIADTYAYCLMPNHFHFLIKIKDEMAIQNLQGFANTSKDLTGFKNLSGLISKQFSNFFNSYAKAFNTLYNRKGSLFNRPFKQKEVTNDTYFTKLVHYIHANPVHHGFVNTIEDWPFNSYHTFLSEKNTLLKRNEVLEWFNGKQEFKRFHEQPIDIKIDFDLE